MGNLLGGDGGLGGLLGGGGGGGGVTTAGTECCDGVVDPITLLVTLAGIIGAIVFLRQVALDNVKPTPAGRKRKRRNLPQQPYPMHGTLSFRLSTGPAAGSKKLFCYH